MKIGVVTIFHVPNYGAMLQCCALCSYLQSKGHEVLLYDIPLSNPRRLVYKIKRKIKLRFMDKFIAKHLPRYTSDHHEKSDVYMVGSDQVWNPDIVGEHLGNFMLDFAPNDTIKLSYAASFGISEWKYPELTDKVKSLLRQFKSITVREQSGVELLKSVFDIEGQQVLDPCFLYTKEQLQKLAGGSHHIKQKDNLVTFKLVYSYEWYKEAKALAKKLNTPWVELSARYIKKLNDIRGFNVESISVQKWVSSIASAKYVVTDSFHGTVFCLLFNRQFVVVPSIKKRMTRLTSLLCSLGLERRLADNVEQAYDILKNDAIDYNIVNPKLQAMSLSSREYLDNMLNL